MIPEERLKKWLQYIIAMVQLISVEPGKFITLGDFQSIVVTSIIAHGLSSVRFKWSECAKNLRIDSALQEKYSHDNIPQHFILQLCRAHEREPTIKCLGQMAYNLAAAQRFSLEVEGAKEILAQITSVEFFYELE